MKILSTLTIAALTILTLNGAVSASNIHTLDDIRKAKAAARKAAFIQRSTASQDSSLVRKINAIQKNAEESIKKFPGKGNKLGGDKYVNRLLGIDHKEGKRLERLAKKQAKKGSRKQRTVRVSDLVEKKVLGLGDITNNLQTSVALGSAMKFALSLSKVRSL